MNGTRFLFCYDTGSEWLHSCESARCPFLSHKVFVFVFCLYGCPYSFSIGKESSPACGTSIAFPWRFGPLSKSTIIIIVLVVITAVVVIIIIFVVVITIFIIVVVTIVVIVIIIIIIIIIVIIIVVIITLAQSQVE